MFVTRLLSGILLMVIALVTLITGGNLLFFVLLLISLIGMTELYKVFGIEKKPPGIIGYIAAAAYYGLLYFQPQLPGESLDWFMLAGVLAGCLFSWWWMHVRRLNYLKLIIIGKSL